MVCRAGTDCSYLCRHEDAWLRCLATIFALQTVDDDGTCGISEDVGGGAEHIEESVDCVDEVDVVEGQAHGGRDDGHGNESGAGNGGGTDGCQDGSDENDHCFAR